MNVTISGRTCQAWSAQEPQKHGTPWVGDHNHCRINNEYGGVRCITTDPDKRWEFCDVPICVNDKQELSTIDPGCQEGNPLGASYSGNVSHTISGIPCQTWSTKVPHDHDYTEVGEHNYCRNPDGSPNGVWCLTAHPAKRWEYCDVPLCSTVSLTYDCQDAESLGATYRGSMSVAESGRTCQSWSAAGRG